MALELLGRLGLFHRTQACIPSNCSASSPFSCQVRPAERTSEVNISNPVSICSRSLRFPCTGNLANSNARKLKSLQSSSRRQLSSVEVSDGAWHKIQLGKSPRSPTSLFTLATKFLHPRVKEEPENGRARHYGSCVDPCVVGPRQRRRRFHCVCSFASSSIGLCFTGKAANDRQADWTSSNMQLPFSLYGTGRVNWQVQHALLQGLGRGSQGETEFPSLVQLDVHGVRAAAGKASQTPQDRLLEGSSRRGKFLLPSEAQNVKDPWRGITSSLALELLHPDRQYEVFVESSFGTRIARFRQTRSTCYFYKSLGTQTNLAQPLTSARPRRPIEKDQLLHRRTSRQCIPHSRDTPPKRDTGIASEQEWGINLKDEKTSESGVNAEGGSWYRESGEDLGENGYRCRWTVMGGRNADGSSEWKEAWWEKSDWTGYKELGVEKSGKNAQGDSWWETWQEILRQDDWSNLARIEKSAQKQAKSGSGSAGWYEKWWEKYNAKGWSEKGAHKYGRLSDQGWWEKWGEQYDGRGGVLKWTDKWAETDLGTKWGDKWEEKFDHGMGTRQGETWHLSSNGERWSRTWGEEHFGNGTVHKYGKSTSGENWDNMVEEGTFYQAEPHYGWADAVGNSVQLLAIEALERPPGIYPDLDLGMNEE